MENLNPFLFFITVGAVLVITEIVIFGMSVFWFLLIGIGALVAATIAWQIPEISWVMATVSFVVASTITSALLYLPLKRWQQTPSVMDGGSDAIGQSVEVLTDINEHNSGQVMWSGAKWAAKLADGSQALQRGETANIVDASGIVLLVKK